MVLEATKHVFVDHDGQRISLEFVDDISHEMCFIAHEHHEIHEGSRFAATEYVSNLAHAGTRYYKIVTGANVVHFLPKISVDNALIFQILEGSTVTVDGSALTFRNRNRGSANTALTTAFAGSTVTVDGTAIYNSLLGAAKAVGDSRSEDEWNLLPNTTYVLKLDNSPGTGVTDVSVNLDIYEESP